MMDSLFLMQRYWGSDEENEEEKITSSFCSPVSETKFSKKRHKEESPVICVDSDVNDDSCNKKQKLCSQSKIINEENTKLEFDTSIGKKIGYSLDSELENVNSISNNNSLENEISVLNITDQDSDVSTKVTKKQKFKDMILESNESDVMLDHVNSLKKKKNRTSMDLQIICDNDNESKVTKKQKVKDKSLCTTNGEILCVEKVTSEVENDQVDMKKSSVSSPKKKKSKTSVNGQVIVHDTDKPEKTKPKMEDKSLNVCNEDTKFLERVKSEVISLESDESDEVTECTPSNMNKSNENTVKEESNIVNKKSLKSSKKQKLKDSNIKNESEEMEIDETKPNIAESENNDQVFCTIGKVYKPTNENVKHALPSWLSNPTYISINLQEAEVPVSELKYLDSNTKKNLNLAGINFLFPVQLAVIPWLMQSKQQSSVIRPSDICVSAPTGSGKTLAFVLPIIQSLKDRVVRAVRALVVLPVGELAIQVYKVFETFVRGTDLKVALLTGKKSFTAEQDMLVKVTNQSVLSLVDIVVTTPGRIHDHIHQTKGFCLKRLKYLVIDEADRMMDEIQKGWLKQVEEAVFCDCNFPNCVCSSYKRIFYEPTSAHNFGFVSQPLQKLLYSATLTHDPEILHSLSLYKPKLFTTSGSVSSDRGYIGSCAIPSELKMSLAVCDEGLKPMAICHLIKSNKFKKVLCFTESVERAHRLHVVLEEMGLFKVREVSSFNSAVQRKIVLEQFSSGKIDILVCSDLVARGMDIDNVDCVISYDVPQLVKIYIHRIGRTARAGKSGVAVTLLSEGEIPAFKKMLKPAGIEMPEKVYVNSEDLKPFVDKFQKALSIADNKIKKERQVAEKSKKLERKS